MNNEELINENNILREKILKLENKLNEFKEKLNTYQSNSKKYYENNKDVIIEKVKNYKKIINIRQQKSKKRSGQEQHT